jgi:hypothetical protein
MRQELHMQLDRSSPLFFLLIRKATLALHDLSLQRMIMALLASSREVLVALLTQVEFWTLLAVITITRHDVQAARTTGHNELRNVRVVDVIKSHHRCMFCPTRRVKLIVIALAEIEELLPSVEEFAFYLIVDVLSVILRIWTCFDNQTILDRNIDVHIFDWCGTRS